MGDVDVLLDLVRRHNEYAAGRIDLVASNAWVSTYARLSMGSALSNSYAIGSPGNRLYGGCAYIDMIEREVVSAATGLFGTKHASVQLLSGMQANFAAYHALLSRGDKVVASPARHGGHYSHGAAGPLQHFAPVLVEAPFDPDVYNLDVDGLRVVFARERPKLLIVGWSEFLFPHPLAELRALCDRYGVRLMYDMSHVAGLIAGGLFQPESGSLADIITSSTGKSLHAPDHGLVLYDDASLEPALNEAVMPMLTSNTHPHEVAALGIALAEMEAFGAEYARQVVANTKALGAALHDRGVDVLYGELDYSESHTLLVEHEHAHTAMALLDTAGISCNTTPLPHDRFGPDSGLRLGTQVLTRRGMREPQMEQVAEAIARLLLAGEDPVHVGYELVRPLAERFVRADYSFDAKFPLPSDWQHSPYRRRRVRDVPDLAALVPAFSALSLRELDLLADDLDVVTLRDGELLLSAGDVADAVFFVVEGTIAITDESARIAYLGPGDHVGEVAVLTSRPRTMSAHAAEPAVLLRIGATAFARLLDSSPAVRRHFDEYLDALELADRARAATS